MGPIDRGRVSKIAGGATHRATVIVERATEITRVLYRRKVAMPIFTTVPIHSLLELRRWAARRDPLDPSALWAFRGQSSDQELSTTFDRVCNEHRVAPSRRPELERVLIREFARKAHLHLPASELPDPGDTLEWLSLMRHYGAPTRLMDWTHSLMVAVHFALAGDARGHIRYVFAISTAWVNQRANQLFDELDKGGERDRDKGGKHFRRFFMSDAPRPFVSTANPYRVNERLALQKGVFLCPADVRRSFDDNLAALGGGPRRLFRLDLARGCWLELRDELFRLNIDEEVLFPGIEGLARSLKTRAPQFRRIVPPGRADMRRLGRAPR